MAPIIVINGNYVISQNDILCLAFFLRLLIVLFGMELMLKGSKGIAALAVLFPLIADWLESNPITTEFRELFMLYMEMLVSLLENSPGQLCRLYYRRGPAWLPAGVHDEEICIFIELRQKPSLANRGELRVENEVKEIPCLKPFLVHEIKFLF